MVPSGPPRCPDLTSLSCAAALQAAVAKGGGKFKFELHRFGWLCLPLTHPSKPTKGIYFAHDTTTRYFCERSCISR